MWFSTHHSCLSSQITAAGVPIGASQVSYLIAVKGPDKTTNCRPQTMLLHGPTMLLLRVNKGDSTGVGSGQDRLTL